MVLLFSVALFLLLTLVFGALGLNVWARPKAAIDRITGVATDEQQVSVRHPSLVFHDLVKKLGAMLPASPKDTSVMGMPVLVYGLRGNAFRSADGGATWTKIDTGLPASIVGGTATAPGTVVLADQGGRIALSSDGGVTFELIPMQRQVPLTSITDAGAGRLAVTGPFGVMLVGPDAPR